MALQLAIGLTIRAGHWTLWRVPWWACLIGIVPEALLLVPLVFDRSRHCLERLGHRTAVSVALFGVVSLANALLLVALVASLIAGHEQARRRPTSCFLSSPIRSWPRPAGRPRLFDYLYVSFTNSIAFSPTDTMPLTQAAKCLMLTEAAVSSVTVLQSALSNRSVHR
jgi:hypothetical protein